MHTYIRSKITLLALIPVLCACMNYAHISTVRNNVCKTLEQKVVLYAIFVDSDATHPWSGYDVQSTMDSIQVAINWVEKQAQQRGIGLNIQLERAHREEVIPFKEEFKYKTLSGTLFKFTNLSRGIRMVDDWSNNIAKDVARTLPNDTSKVVLTKNKSNDRERLIAKLRNQYQTDNIAVLYFINNYFENEISVALHTASGTETEYAVVSTKAPAVIAHEFLHIFGAWDLYLSPFDKHLFERCKKRRAMKKYPNEIMAFTYRDLDTLQISPLTEYLIGWDDKLDKGAGKPILKKRWRVLEY